MITSSPLKRTKSLVCVAQRTAEEPSTKKCPSPSPIQDLPIRFPGPQATFLRAHKNVGSVRKENVWSDSSKSFYTDTQCRDVYSDILPKVTGISALPQHPQFHL